MSAKQHGWADDPVPPLYDLSNAAVRLGVSPRMVRELWARRELGGIKVGRHVRFSEADLIEFVERHHRDPIR